MGELEKRAVTAKLLGALRHPINPVARKVLENSFRRKRIKIINDGIVGHALKWTGVETGLAKASRFIFFPNKIKGFDPVKKWAPGAAAKKTTEIMQDNPELLPLALFSPYPMSVPIYLGGKVALYKALKIPTAGHMRHIQQRERIYDAANRSAGAVALGGAGVAGRSKVQDLQKDRKKSGEDKRAEMYKAAAAEIRKIVTNEPPSI